MPVYKTKLMLFKTVCRMFPSSTQIVNMYICVCIFCICACPFLALFMFEHSECVVRERERE